MFALALDLWQPAVISGASRAKWLANLAGRFGGVTPDVYVDFVTRQAYQAGQPSVLIPDDALNCVSASTRYRDDSQGNWLSFAPNVLAYTNKGLRVWESRTNVVLWDRDLTNAAWTKTNATAALNQTGIDNTANSASSITATAGNATVLQSITLASSARFQTAFVKRIIGSGTINMTMDGGATWTAIPVIASWSRVSIPTQTIANPSVGFQIVTNGDAIAVDFVQNEGGTFASPPALTTSAAVITAAEVVTLKTPPTFGSAATYYVAYVNSGIVSGGVASTLTADDGTTANFDRMNITQAASRNASANTFSAAVNEGRIDAAGVYVVGAFTKAAYALANNDRALTSNGGAVATSGTGARPVSLTAVTLGSAQAASFLDGDITELAIWASTRLPNASLISGTQ
jgi:hypothetical protein